MKKAIAITVGFLAGLLLFAVGREIVWAFQARPAGEVLSAALTYLGQFVWLNQYQTLITGTAAAAAVGFQIRHAERMERDRFEAKRASARSMLPLILSDIGEYADRTAGSLDHVLDLCAGKILPSTAVLPDFVEPPTEAVEKLARMVEYSRPDERIFLSRLLATVQVLRSRLNSMITTHASGKGWTFDSNIHAMIVDCAEIYARTAVLFNYGRLKSDAMPTAVSTEDINSALMQMNLSLPDHTVESYGLDKDGVFDRWT